MSTKVRKSFEEEREEGYVALEEYMAMMLREHRERCGRSGISHGTQWCKIEAGHWARGHDLDPDNHNDTARWPGWDQFMFIRDDVLNGCFGRTHLSFYPPRADYGDQVGASVPDVVVVGTHRSKSIDLPVMQFKWRDLLVTTRYNYHDWKVSIQLPEPIDPSEDLLDIAATEDHLLHPVYFEGFPKEYIYRPLATGDYLLTGQFSTVFGSKYKLYTFFWLMKRWYEGRFGPLD